MGASVHELIRRLGTSDERARRSAGFALLRMGAPAVGALAEALLNSSPEVRKPAAFLLGRSGDTSPAVIASLERALTDSEPKVRKNAAMALGRLGPVSAVPALSRALSTEDTLWVRPSMVLALGALGSPAAEALAEVEPRSPKESEALRKALDRAVGQTQAVRWNDDGRLPMPPRLAVPPGLEAVAIAEALERGLPAPTRLRPGLLQCDRVGHTDLFPALRCAYEVRYLIASGPQLAGPEADLPLQVRALLAGAGHLAGWRDWIDASDDVLRYRFSLSGLSVARDTLRRILAEARTVLRPLGLEDSPSAYTVELRLENEHGSSDLYFVPTFIADDRFEYRAADVGASINPVVGACLARLSRMPNSRLAFDPTCGSGTLLIERARLDDRLRCIGTDVSPTAVRAAQANVQTAALANRIDIRRSDAAEPRTWPKCDEVLANLPFGLRTGRRDANYIGLYGEIAANLSRALRPAGRAVLYTSDRSAIDAALSAHISQLKVERTLRTESGGVDVGVWVVGRHSA